MAIIKCKICGGTLEFSENSSVCQCQYCGTKQTLPRISGEYSTTLYERADHFRRNNDFDKAIGIYEQILNENNTDAEAYWSLVLCRYGVEYVEDPKSNKRIATVNRMQYTSVLADEDYKSAIRYADAAQREIYEAEAKEIDSIQKGILAISQKEEPFDVFICYKETDNSGRRTPDSVLANELYHQLDNEGYKVFFSRITLEDKLGTAYEPYIFAALNSAKVMVVIGTKAEYFNAVWVRNEWSRFLALIKNGANKVLIPAYRDMDPYDLPEEFSHLQAQDMSKLGFMQDLIRGIEKLTGVSKPKQVKEQSVLSGTNTAPLLRRAFIFLEDGDFESADEYCEKVLDLDPENGEAYLGKLMAELKIRRRENLSEQTAVFEDNANYKKALRFGSDELQNELKSAIKAINQRAERARLTAAYKKADLLFASTKAKEDYLKAAEAFDSIGDFEDAKQRAAECREKHKQAHFGGLYAAAVVAMKYAKTEEDFIKARNAFEQIGEYKDSRQLASECTQKAEFIHNNTIYTAAVALMTGNKVSNYKKAISQFEKIRGFKDSDAKIELCNRKIEQINAAVLAADIEKQNRAQARVNAIQAGANAMKEKLPLIKKVVLVVVPVLVVAILAAAILPKIDFAKPKDNSDSMEGTTYATTIPATLGTEPAETQPATTQPTETQPATTQPQKPPTQRPSTQQPSTQSPSTQQPATPVSPMDRIHAEGCPSANGDILSREKGTLYKCQSIHASFTDENNVTREWMEYEHENRDGSDFFIYRYDASGKQLSYQDGKYNSIGKEILLNYYDEAGNLLSYTTNEYNANGYCIASAYYDSKGNCESKTKSEYDSAGRMVKSESWHLFTFEGYHGSTAVLPGYTKLSTSYYTPDAFEKIRNEVIYDTAGNLCEKSEKEFEYSADGRLIKSITRKTHLENKETRFGTAKSGDVLTEEVSYDSSGRSSFYVIYACNAAGQIYGREESYYNSEGSVVKVIEYFYDAAGNVTSWRELKLDGKGNTLGEIRYDANGNVIG